MEVSTDVTKILLQTLQTLLELSATYEEAFSIFKDVDLSDAERGIKLLDDGLKKQNQLQRELFAAVEKYQNKEIKVENHNVKLESKGNLGTENDDDKKPPSLENMQENIKIEIEDDIPDENVKLENDPLKCVVITKTDQEQEEADESFADFDDNEDDKTFTVKEEATSKKKSKKRGPKTSQKGIHKTGRPPKIPGMPKRVIKELKRNMRIAARKEKEAAKNEVQEFRCDKCFKGYKSSEALKVHLRVHTGERPYKCELCGMSFAYHTSIKRHMMAHRGEKPYKCDQCLNAFVDKRHLKEHMRIHTGEKPYACTVCGKAFARKPNLKQHFVIHTGERPYKCDICHQGFTQNSSLKCHYRTHAKNGEQFRPKPEEVKTLENDQEDDV
eukprot:TRINITY_DN2750_c3_g1_i2.p1 TRINITY_DN2750_c3_g1~~TRINITY_DN2750_c3_g1_i2.p1  ORF type:complete len:385 (-),score=75.31 TRINITY_DN2750_c3_g1_i2:64-1218(-)